MNEHPPTFDLDCFLAGEAERAVAERVEQHVDSCGECRTYLDTRAAEQAAHSEQLSPQVFANRVSEQFAAEELVAELSQSWARPRRLAWGVGFAALASALVVLLVLTTQGPREDTGGPSLPGEDDIRWMGAAPVVRLQILRNDQLVIDVDPIPGDRLQYEVTMPPGEIGYGMVIAAEGERVFVVLPEDGRPAELSDVSRVPGSVAFEPGGVIQLYLFVRAEPFSARTVVDEVHETFVVGGGGTQQLDGLVHRMTVDLNP